MSNFKFEAITDEAYIKIVNQNKCKDSARVTPLHYPKDFPIDIPEDGHCVLSHRYEHYAESIKNLKVRSDDMWVLSYPKTGTTWTQELVWLLLNDLDFQKAKETPLVYRFPFLEVNLFGELGIEGEFVDIINETPSPRFIKSHLPIQFMPDQIWSVKPKIIYVKRNPKDVAVSYFHHYKLFHRYTGTLDEFIDCFVQDNIYWAPVYPHMVNFCRAAKKLDNILILSFEELKKDLKSVIRKVAKFLKVSVSDEDIEKLADHLSFKNMRENASINFEIMIKPNLEAMGIEDSEDTKFIRKGNVGSWKQELSSKSIKKLEEWTLKNEELYPLSKKYI